jgi:hypothetical protein
LLAQLQQKDEQLAALTRHLMVAAQTATPSPPTA